MTVVFFGHAKYLMQSPCPACGEALDGITPTSLETPSPDFIPKEGDFSICIFCASVLRYELHSRLRAATGDDLAELSTTQPETFATLFAMVAAAKGAISDRRRKNRRKN